MAAIKPISVPFDANGDMCHSDYRGGTDIREFDKPFYGRFEFDQIWHYTSSVTTFTDGMGHKYYMSQGVFESVIKHLVKGVLEGAFYFRKQGKYYSLIYLPDAVI